MLEMKHVSKTYGDTKAVNDLSFSIPKGEVLGLLGHNGAGKSTTIKMILGILDANQGDIHWEGKPLRHAGVRMGYLPEERGLYEKSKVSDQILYFAKLEGMKKKEAEKNFDYWLERLGIPMYKHKSVHELSKGNRQKIQLIAALVHDPELIILDEPFSGLDPVNAGLFADVIQELMAHKKTIILSSHRMEQLDQFCKQILVLKKGQDILSGNLDAIKKEYGIQRIEMKGSEALTEHLDRNGYSYTSRGDYLDVNVTGEQQAFDLYVSLKTDGHVLRHFVMREPNLNEIFLKAVGK